jgi:hypothetical protein
VSWIEAKEKWLARAVRSPLARVLSTTRWAREQILGSVHGGDLDPITGFLQVPEGNGPTRRAG